MAKSSSHYLEQEFRQAGYDVLKVEQLRTNRWVLTLRDETKRVILVLVQARLLVSSADVHDLADLVRLRRPDRGVLLAYGGSLSPAAQGALKELNDQRLRFCVVHSSASASNRPESGQVVAALKSLSW